jgi:hypothetical protein
MFFTLGDFTQLKFCSHTLRTRLGVKRALLVARVSGRSVSHRVGLQGGPVSPSPDTGVDLEALCDSTLIPIPGILKVLYSLIAFLSVRV